MPGGANPSLTLRDEKSGSLCGIMGVHVDDTAVGGAGPLFEEAVRKLKARFPYRKWRILRCILPTGPTHQRYFHVSKTVCRLHEECLDS